MSVLDELIRQRDVALRELARFDSVEKGSKWFSHPEEGVRLIERVRVLVAAVESA